jgi:hypothetical protein
MDRVINIAIAVRLLMVLVFLEIRSYLGNGGVHVDIFAA